MKIYGYSKNEVMIDNAIEPYEMAEITLVANPEELRNIASFIQLCATEMAKKPTTWQHEHLSDNITEFETSPHLVVFNPEAL